MSADTEAVAEPQRPAQMPPSAQASASQPAPEAPQATAKAVSSLSAQLAPLRLGSSTRPPNLAPIADASPATTLIELSDDPPMQNNIISAPQPIPAPRAVPAAQASPAIASPGSSAVFGSPVSTTHLRSRSPHSPSSPAFTASSSGSSRARGRPTSGHMGSFGVAIAGKPRSNSALTTNRPAPLSPASSRPQSQIFELSPRGSPITGIGSPIAQPALARSTPSPSGRERAASVSSAVSQGRRMRPRSTLGTSVLSASQGTTTSDPTTPYTPPATILARRGGSFDARSGGLELPAAAKEAEGELAGSSCSSEGTSSPPPSGPASAAAAPGSPVKGPAPKSTFAHLAASLVRRVIVRDFAFSQDDERFLGLGSQRPRSNWGEGEPEPEPSPVKQPHGGFGFLGHWGFLRRETDPDEPDTDAGGVEDIGTVQDVDDYWSEADEFDHDHDYYLDDEEPDGLYRAAFAFEPEGMNEMAVDVGDLLDVRGRGGGGDGWVVATRLDNGAEGLVPEGYLERAGEDEFPAEWAAVRDVRAKLAAACAESPPRELSASPESEVDEEDRIRAVLALSGAH